MHAAAALPASRRPACLRAGALPSHAPRDAQHGRLVAASGWPHAHPCRAGRRRRAAGRRGDRGSRRPGHRDLGGGGPDAGPGPGLRGPAAGRGARAARPGRQRLGEPQPALRRAADPHRRARAVLAAAERRGGPGRGEDPPTGAAPAGLRGRGDHPLRPRPGAAGPGALRPGRHGRSRAALAADRRQGVRPGPAQPLGPAQRRAEEADARHRLRRLRPAEPADRRAPRRGPHRHRPAPAAPAALRRRPAHPPDRRLGLGRDGPPDHARRRRRPARDPRRPGQVHPGGHQPGRERRPARRGHRVGHARTARPG